MFETELQMQNEFVNLLKINKKEKEIVLEEFNARFGNVDVVIADAKNIEIKINQAQAEVLSNYATALVVAFLHRKKAHNIQYLLKKTGYTEEYLTNILNILKKANIIIEKNKKFLICNEFEFPKLKFIAYELKLKQWKKAILQAIKNKNFAYHSYVVMPDKVAKKLYEKEMEIFNVYNIGLIGVKENEIKYYIKPLSNNIQKITINPIFISSIAKYLLKEKA